MITHDNAEPPLVTYLDLETTSNTLNESQALALVNFATLFHERTYINDTPLGDSGVLITSFLSENTSSPDNGRLYDAVARFLAAGVLLPHVRDAAPTKASKPENFVALYEDWHKRDVGPVFTSEVHGAPRLRYYAALDAVLEAAKRDHTPLEYSVDQVRPRFREHIRALVDRPGDFRQALVQSGSGVEGAYRRACELERFTIANLYAITREHLKNPIVERLNRLQGLVNHETYAHAARSGLGGAYRHDESAARIERALRAARDGSGGVPAPLEVPAGLPKTFDEAYESANIRLELPAVYTLSALTPKDVLELRRGASRYFRFAERADEFPDIHTFMKAHMDVLAEHVDRVSAYLVRRRSQSSGLSAARAVLLLHPYALELADNTGARYIDFTGVLARVGGRMLGALVGAKVGGVPGAVAGVAAAEALERIVVPRLFDHLPDRLVLLFEDSAVRALRQEIRTPTDWHLRNLSSGPQLYSGE